MLRFDETLAARSSVEQEGWIVVNAYVEEEKLDKIFVFSPLSAKPITSFSSKHHSHIQACALVPRFGLLFACDGALYSLSTLTNARNNQPMVARVKHSKLPAVSLSSVEKVQEKSDSHVLSAEESRSLSHSRQEVVPTTLAQSGKVNSDFVNLVRSTSSIEYFHCFPATIVILASRAHTRSCTTFNGVRRFHHLGFGKGKHHRIILSRSLGETTQSTVPHRG